jgi:hypothetical protein
MSDPITLAGIDIDPERFPKICTYAHQNPEGVQEKLLSLLGTESLEAALESLELDFSS